MNFIDNYYIELNKLLLNSDIKKKLFILKDLIINCSNSGGSVFILGNGGSASTASHVSVDLTKNAKIKSYNFNEANLITCLANDYSYEDWMTEALKLYSNHSNDLIIFLSCSGNSRNLLNALRWSKSNGKIVVSLTGNEPTNNLINENINGLNLWVNSKSYNIIEIVHHAWMLSIIDFIIGKSEYPVTPLNYKKL
jgi:D-sedoheptulose 7-phosphate isomerase